MKQEQKKKKSTTPDGLKAEVEIKPEKTQIPQVEGAIDGIDNVLEQTKVKSRMVQLRGATGDEPLIEWDPDDADSVMAAEAKFEDLKSQGWSILTTDGEGNSEAVKKFDAQTQEYFVIPQIAGGVNAR